MLCPNALSRGAAEREGKALMEMPNLYNFLAELPGTSTSRPGINMEEAKGLYKKSQDAGVLTSCPLSVLPTPSALPVTKFSNSESQS